MALLNPILVLNVGSSTLKARVYRLPAGPLGEDPAPHVWDALVDWGGGPATLRLAGAPPRAIEAPPLGLQATLASIWTGGERVLDSSREIAAVGHRIVHGGSLFHDAVVATQDVREAIRGLGSLAPAHNPLELAVLEEAASVFGEGVPQIAAFDTAFHQTLPPESYAYPGPREWLDRGIRRYGFHGISHEYVSRRAARLLGRDIADLQLITCHLGNGCSLAAIRGGRSVDTTMGYTPLEGLMMGSRSGSVDPGILVHLVRGGAAADDLDRVLNQESGLKGLSGASQDLREVLAERARGNEAARLAFSVYVHRLRQGIGSMLSSLTRLDAIVFTGGVGENSAEVRSEACKSLATPGVRIDEARNASPGGDRDVAAADSQSRVLVIHTEEDWEIARKCAALLASSPRLTA